MQALSECSWVFGPEYWDRQECEACKARWKLHGKLHAELRLGPLMVQHPDIENYYSDQPNCAGALLLPHAQRLYRELEPAVQNCS